MEQIQQQSYLLRLPAKLLADVQGFAAEDDRSIASWMRVLVKGEINRRKSVKRTSRTRRVRDGV